jgi:hypothetical protein
MFTAMIELDGNEYYLTWRYFDKSIEDLTLVATGEDASNLFTDEQFERIIEKCVEHVQKWQDEERGNRRRYF